MESQTHARTHRSLHHRRSQQERCTRRTGNPFLSADDDGWELTCLQCGRTYALSEHLPQVVVPVRERVAA